MPIYEYKCRDCGSNFEKLCSISTCSSGVNCPSCESANIRRLISSFYSHSAGSGSGGSSSNCGSCSSSTCSGCSCH